MRHYKQLQLQYNVLRTGMVRNLYPQYLLSPQCLLSPQYLVSPQYLLSLLLPGHSVFSLLVYRQQRCFLMQNAMHFA